MESPLPTRFQPSGEDSATGVAGARSSVGFRVGRSTCSASGTGPTSGGMDRSHDRQIPSTPTERQMLDGTHKAGGTNAPGRADHVECLFCFGEPGLLSLRRLDTFPGRPSSTFWMGRQGRFSPGCLVLLSSVSPDPPGTRLRWIATHCRRLGVGPPALTARPHLCPGVSDGESCGPCGFPTASQETGAGLSRVLNQW